MTWTLSLSLVEKLILNSLHLPSFIWNLSFEAVLLNTSTAFCRELNLSFATISQIVVSSTYFGVRDIKIVDHHDEQPRSQCGALSNADRD